MSCMIQKPENTAAIAEYISHLLNMGFDFCGMSAPESLFHELDECNIRGYYEESEIYEKLRDLNRAAYVGRYPDGLIVESMGYKENTIDSRAEWTGEHWEIKNWHYKMLKMIQFFNYQCEEDATINDPLHKAMEQLEKALMQFIVMNSAQYNAQPWE